MLRLNLGDLVTWQGDEHVVIAARAQAAMLRRLADNDTVWVDVPSLADEITLADRALADSPTQGTVPIIAEFSEAELEAARWWVPHLHEVIHGVTDPDDHELQPRAGYETKSKTSRRQLKADELAAAGIKVDVRTLARKERAYVDRGVPGLIPRRRPGGASGVPAADDRVIEAIVAVLADTTASSTVTVSTMMNKAHAYLARTYPGQDIPTPSKSTMRRLFAAYDRRGLATGKATSRRTEANRHGRGPRPVAATTPGQYVEIDSTPINVLALYSDGSVGRAHLTVAMDIATRSILAFDIVPVGATGVEHADLLARILRPRSCRPDAPDYMRLDKAADLPVRDMQAADERQVGAIAVPYIVPETITTDRGKDYLSDTFVAACRYFGIGVIQAPPHSPTFKGHIERLMRTVETSWMQHLPGYVGNSVANRGREIDSSGLLTIGELRDSFEAWWVRVYQRRAHNELRDRDLPARRYSPNQMYSVLFDAGAGIPVPIDETTYIGLMPTVTRTIQNNGFRIDNLIYWHDDLPALAKMRPPTRDGKWAVRRDPYDVDRVWVQHPETSEWLGCVSESYRRDTYPFASAMRLLRDLPKVAEQGGDVQDEWAIEQLAEASAKATPKERAGRKRRERANAVKARRAADAEPRPQPVAVPQPADATRADAAGGDSDDFALVRNNDRFWND
ncbi:hypothetical protein GCM10027062_46040 [Nocardioides hungaricus]